MITGAAQGLGAAYARLAAELGARVLLTDIAEPATQDRLNAEVDAIRRRGFEAEPYALDVRDEDGAAEAIQAAVERFGALHGVVNNAGVLADRLLVNMTLDEWRHVLDVHATGTFLVTREAGRYWRQRHRDEEPISRPAIVNTTSVAGLAANVGQANYAAAKAAIAAFTLVAAQELSRFGVRVNAVAPLARTRLTEGSPGIEPGDARDGFDRWNPENAAPLVTHLLSPDHDVNGAVFHIVGGQIGLYRGWSYEPLMSNEAPWTPDSIAEVFEGEDLTVSIGGQPAGAASLAMDIREVVPELRS
jgi:NAD(P)-dependent dehydrogenase (short-subunit alcohol dehydrogenase family)